jgi:hypothetical protein
LGIVPHDVSTTAHNPVTTPLIQHPIMTLLPVLNVVSAATCRIPDPCPTLRQDPESNIVPDKANLRNDNLFNELYACKVFLETQEWVADVQL